MKRSSHSYGYVVVSVCFLIFMTTMGMATSFGLFFQPIIEELGWTRTAISGAFSLNGIIGGIFGIAGGYFNDRFGPRFVLTLFGLFTVIGYLLVSKMIEVWQFYLFFGVIVGVGLMVYVPIMSTVAKWFEKRRSLMSGIAFSGQGFGLLVFPMLINWLIRSYNWRMAVVIISMIILLVTILGLVLLRNSPGYSGASKGVNTGKPQFNVPVKKKTSGVDAIMTKEFWLLIVVLFCYGLCFVAYQVHIAVYAIDSGISSTNAAMILTVLGAATIFGQIIVSMLGDIIGYKKTFIVGLMCITLAILTITLSHQIWGFIIFAILLGAAFGNCSTQESPLVAWLFGEENHGTLLGIFAFSFSCGGAVGPLVFGLIYDLLGTYNVAFYIAGVLSVLAIVLSLLLNRKELHATKFPV